jgi:hypothetical protein
MMVSGLTLAQFRHAILPLLAGGVLAVPATFESRERVPRSEFATRQPCHAHRIRLLSILMTPGVSVSLTHSGSGIEAMRRSYSETVRTHVE